MSRPSYRRPGARVSVLTRYRSTMEVPIGVDLRRRLIAGLQASRAECTLSRWEIGFTVDMLDRLKAGADWLSPRQFAAVVSVTSKWESKL